MAGIVLVFVLIIVVKLTANANFGCWFIGVFTFIFSAMIMHQLMEFKSDINKFACPFCLPNSLCEKFCTSRKMYFFVALFGSIIMSLSLFSFIILTNTFFLLIIGMDVFVFHYIYTNWNQQTSKQLVPDAKKVGAEVAINFLNVFLLTVVLIAFELMNIKNVEMTPEIFDNINKSVQHSCKMFQHILRTQEFANNAMYAVRNIEGIGQWLFGFFYITSISLFPMVAITLSYKFGIKIEHKYFKKEVQ